MCWWWLGKGGKSEAWRNPADGFICMKPLMRVCWRRMLWKLIKLCSLLRHRVLAWIAKSARETPPFMSNWTIFYDDGTGWRRVAVLRKKLPSSWIMESLLVWRTIQLCCPSHCFLFSSRTPGVSAEHLARRISMRFSEFSVFSEVGEGLRAAGAPLSLLNIMCALDVSR